MGGGTIYSDGEDEAGSILGGKTGEFSLGDLRFKRAEGIQVEML